MRRELCDVYDRGNNNISILMVTRVAIGFWTGYHYVKVNAENKNAFCRNTFTEN